MADFISLEQAAKELATFVMVILSAALASPLTDTLVVALKALEQGVAKLFHKEVAIDAAWYNLAVAAFITVAGWIGMHYDVMSQVDTIFDFLSRAAPIVASLIGLFVGQQATYKAARALNVPVLRYQRSEPKDKAA